MNLQSHCLHNLLLSDSISQNFLNVEDLNYELKIQNSIKTKFSKLCQVAYDHKGLSCSNWRLLDKCETWKSIHRARDDLLRISLELQSDTFLMRVANRRRTSGMQLLCSLSDRRTRSLTKYS